MQTLIHYLIRLFGVFRRHQRNLETEEGRAQERERRMALTVSVGVISRVVGMATTFVMVPVLVGFLGSELYGVWLTVYSLAAWFNLVQLGVPPGLMNELSALNTSLEKGQARRLVSAAFAIQIVLAVCVVCVVALAWRWVPWQQVFNTALPEHAHSASLVVIWLGVMFAIRLPLDLSHVLLASHQEGYKSAAIQLAGSLFGTTLLLLYVRFGDRDLLWLAVWAEAGGLVTLTVSAFAAFRPRPHLLPSAEFLERGAVRRLGSVGGHFMAITIAGLIMNSTDNLVLSYYCGPAAVTPFRLVHMLTQFPVAGILMLLDAAWPAYAEAVSRGDISWLRATHRKFVRVSIAVVAVFALVWGTCGQAVVHWWSGGEVMPSQQLVVAIAAMSSVQCLLLCHGRLLTATGAIRYNAWTSLASTVVNLIASIILVQWIGEVGVAVGTLIGQVSCGWCLIPLANRQIRRLEQRNRDGTA